jgi:hypothetical protein
MPANSPKLSPPSQSLSSDAPIEAIPGVGLVRARCLRKAGWANARALRAATVDQLASVPGVSLTKAAQILAFLASDRQAEVDAGQPTGSPEGPSPLDRIAHSAARLLTAGSAPALRPTLIRQLKQWIRLSGHPEGQHDLTDVVSARAARAANRLDGLLSGRQTGRKRQARLARRLRWLRRRLAV